MVTLLWFLHSGTFWETPSARLLLKKVLCRHTATSYLWQAPCILGPCSVVKVTLHWFPRPGTWYQRLRVLCQHEATSYLCPAPPPPQTPALEFTLCASEGSYFTQLIVTRGRGGGKKSANFHGLNVSSRLTGRTSVRAPVVWTLSWYFHLRLNRW